ncbi:heavy-metal-associated domain-containing protein [Hymenobacter sp. UV11]|uniref:heavy-metal-associated domain-containing protein n=1 Tax=Hymenobacter sp. UV11 TaxID=1849735 RepID=UPI0010605653|nr:heavy metal-associated domain-containing protein [Hymenobacter sp. UV11]TDN36911.1 hypothetical protein A8B98_05805 [Hymenobacter sp. UV11]TFZ64333.1 heavy-metal-associated domain-containing protein [Hymenobacter sp. UV11]
METVRLKNPDSVVRETFAVEGMTCGSCAGTVQRALSAVDGVSSATVEAGSASATVTYDPTVARPADLKEAVAQAGYTLHDQGEAPAKAPRSKGGGCCC